MIRNPMEVLTNVRTFVGQIPNLNAYQVQCYCDTDTPTAKNLREVIESMLPETVLIAYTGSHIQGFGGGWHMQHQFAIYLNFTTVNKNVGACTTLLNGTPDGNYLPFLESVIDEACDPPQDIQITPYQLSEGLEIWELRFGLRERL